MNLRNANSWFWLGVITELMLVLVAAILAWLLGRPLLADFHWRPRDLLWGILAGLPPFAFFLWLMHSRSRSFAEVREFLDTALRPIFGQWSIFQLAMISLLAGICEEILFRSVLQGALEVRVGPVGALIAASLLFGGAHLVTWTYAWVAAVMGVYLGGAWLLTGNLLVPITIHAVYDFAALLYLSTWWKRG